MHIMFTDVYPSRPPLQNGIALPIDGETSTGAPSIFLPISVAQQQQRIAAGQQTICPH